MNQFKPIFLGTVDPTSQIAQLKRACDTQKCIRAGGKHNDLDDVGKDTYHHTFFEMLGNWSFADYFKKESIEWAWELLTTVYKLPKERFYATYFGGDAKQGLEPDLEARELWLRILPEDRVLPFGCKENFWEMGDTGPCGPCTEIHFDRIGGRDASAMVNADSPEVIEIWNLVFIQFNREADGSLKPLPNRHVDTGMGFERVTSLLQNKLSNYDIDLFAPIFASIQEITGASPYTGKLGPEDAKCHDMAYRVIADHIRTLSFAIADGSQPGNDGREYVLRRILRRAVRYGREVLGASGPFLHKLVPTVVAVMGGAFPEVGVHQAKIEAVILEEETSFGRTLQKGIEKFKKAAEAATGNLITGQDAFVLWDTFGFPVDLTQLMAEEKGMKVDLAGFAKAMDDAREVSRAARGKGGGEPMVLDADATNTLAKKMGLVPTEQSPKYELKPKEAKLLAIYTKGGFVQSTTEAGGEAVGLVLDISPFYPEQGGQIYDTGAIELLEGGGRVNITNCQSYAGYVLHIGNVADVSSGEGLTVGCTVMAKVDYERRALVAPNHTCTHLLNYGLKAVLGDRIDQKGSLVTPERLRFDFSYSKPVEPEALGKVEAIVRKAVAEKLPVYAKETPLADAKRIMGLRAVFGETYPDPVRVVSVGQPVDALLKDPENPLWNGYSIEFCGGTHLVNTGDAGDFVLVSEEGIAKGIRRVIALTSGAAKEALALGAALQARADAATALSDAELEKEVNALKLDVDAATISAATKAAIRDTITSLQKRLLAAFKEAAAKNKELAIEQVTSLAAKAAASGASFAVGTVDVGVDADALKAGVTQATAVHASVALAVFSKDDAKGKALAYVSVPPDVGAKGLDFNAWLKVCLDPIGGKGGGKAGVAQGQGTNPEKLAEAVSAAQVFASKALSS
eukprot:jgi/Mesvir1/1155/Mv17662-RA.1